MIVIHSVQYIYRKVKEAVHLRPQTIIEANLGWISLLVLELIRTPLNTALSLCPVNTKSRLLDLCVQ